MNDLTPPPMGHNLPPDPIDAITGAHEADRIEAENWLDGTRVETEGQMAAVDALRQSMRIYRMALEGGQKSATAPLYDTYKAELARWKPTIEDARRIEDGLVSLVDAFKRKLAAEKAEREAVLRAEAERLAEEARQAHRAADPGDIEATRAADAAIADAERAARTAKASANDTVKGMRTFDVTDVLDYRGLINWLAVNRKDDLRDWMTGYATKNRLHIPGVVETRKEKRAA